MLRISFLALSFFLLVNVLAQSPPVVPPLVYGLRDPGKELNRYCGQCIQLMNNMPKEIGMGFFVDEKNDIYFVFSDAAYFNKLILGPYDGIAVDIITKDQYPCGGQNKYATSPLYKGYLAKPLFKEEIKANSTVSPEGILIVKMMPLPAYFQKKEVEFNVTIIKNKYSCWYNKFFDLQSHHWGLLDMGMYMDTLSEESLKEKSYLLGKRLIVEVPFAKDKYEYQAKDIKPLYDSLKLTNYDIHSIVIRAFASIEGTTERNLELQQKRSQSMISALQSLQAIQFDSIRKEIITSENWVEFYEDIQNTKHSYLRDLGKDELKQKLNTDKTLTASLESILKKHRKAVIILELEPKSALKEKDPEKIKTLFDQHIASKNINEALNLQREIFKRVRSHQLPEQFLAQLEVPEQIDYGLLKNNLAAYKYQQNVTDLFETLKQYKRLADILPNSHRIKYNICVLELKGWLSSELLVDPAALLKSIESLNQSPIDKRLIKRLLINYHIIRSEQMMAQRDYEEKDISLKFIYDNYIYLNLSDEDILSLSQYFVQYSQLKWAEKLLYQYVKRVNVGEDLLFYYLNLTIADPAYTDLKEYRPVMLNAINVNKNRFCSLFNVSGKDGGITFQLLDDLYLKNTYCENCR